MLGIGTTQAPFRFNNGSGIGGTAKDGAGTGVVRAADTGGDRRGGRAGVGKCRTVARADGESSIESDGDEECV